MPEQNSESPADRARDLPPTSGGALIDEGRSGRVSGAESHAAAGAGQDATPRTPDEYLEQPGSHRRPDGTATDVGG